MQNTSIKNALYGIQNIPQTLVNTGFTEFPHLFHYGDIPHGGTFWSNTIPLCFQVIYSNIATHPNQIKNDKNPPHPPARNLPLKYKIPEPRPSAVCVICFLLCRSPSPNAPPYSIQAFLSPAISLAMSCPLFCQILYIYQSQIPLSASRPVYSCLILSTVRNPDPVPL